MASELEIAIKNIIQRTKELNQFKYSGSVKVGEIEKIQEAGESMRESYEDPNGTLAKIIRQYSQYKERENRQPSSRKIKQELKRLIMDMESRKIIIEKANVVLDTDEERFRRYNLPKRYQMTFKQPLKPYLERLQEYMNVTWRQESKKNREKEQRSLIERMEKIDQSNEEGKIAFNALKTAFIELGFNISMLFIEYFFLIMAVSDKREEIVSYSHYEVDAILKCLNVEENSNSIVIKAFGSVLKFFEGAMKFAGPFSDDAMCWKSKEENSDEEKVIFFLEDDLRHMLIMEVLRLEVCFCSPDLPMKLTNEVFFSMAIHLVENGFEDKLEGVGAKIDRLKSDIHFFQEEDSSVMKSLRQVLEAGIKELWTELYP